MLCNLAWYTQLNRIGEINWRRLGGGYLCFWRRKGVCCHEGGILAVMVRRRIIVDVRFCGRVAISDTQVTSEIALLMLVASFRLEHCIVFRMLGPSLRNMVLGRHMQKLLRYRISCGHGWLVRAIGYI